METVPPEARPVSRILLIDPRDRLLLLEALVRSTGRRFWVTPGGGIEGDETFEQAAGRELFEETGIDTPIGPWVWTRRHVYEWDGQTCDQYERFFVARVAGPPPELAPTRSDHYVVGHRWWRLEEIVATDQTFTPTSLARHLPAILAGEVPSPPIDCGV